jgi:MFS family permease
MRHLAESGDSPWSQPGFAPFWTAFSVSSFGNYVTTLAIQVLVVLTLHEGAGGVGLVQAALWFPYLLFGVMAGVLVDRSQRRPLLIATDLSRGVLLVAIPLLATTHDLTLTTLVIFMAMFGLLSLVNDAAAQAFLPRLVPRHLLVAANARLDQSDAVAQTSGPAVAGALVSRRGQSSSMQLVTWPRAFCCFGCLWSNQPAGAPRCTRCAWRRSRGSGGSTHTQRCDPWL